ncbi:UNVERIFIED_CONTAM: hypothetical protein PYX00_002816 [Menopon gallinae]|uniref:Mitogen-activated protein kinase kinase kinase n=1 Tax=Menopon gallinae TaxID=328185 RepID=A0AAW2HXN3_9NEOP
MCDAWIRVPVHDCSRESAEAGAKSLDFRLLMESPLQPISPDPNCEESMKIYQEHEEMAREYLEVQQEMAYLTEYMKDLGERLSNSEQQRQQIEQLTSEKESLEQLQQNLSRQLELLQRDRSEGWVYVPTQGPRLT